ncbi:hypothetical protein AYI70_g4279 [Smittium culicis]|uniref:Xylanolytic transcriptional activator regulatory domain-containing protein n=1 Tax=Smittium culicis TaxID=133412 RepID=A0A1R1XZU1_9FUNG|nr:hypothetical protein AYI70_g4279 [Smittium culicis]
MDSTKYSRANSNEEWVLSEVKRRIWWYLYIRNVMTSLNLGTINKISPKDMAVKLPSHDYYFQNYDSDPSLKDYNLNLPSTSNKIVEIDEHYILTKAYIELGQQF